MQDNHTSPAASNQVQTFNVLILGSGAAGLATAIRLGEKYKTAVISKSQLNESSTYYAQGGISSVLGGQDCFASHIDDTLQVGSGLCDRTVVDFVVKHGPEQIQWLEQLGMHFSQYVDANGKSMPHLTKEGGHSHRRVAHVADATGRSLHQTLLDRAKQMPQISLLSDRIAIDLILRKDANGTTRCCGVYLLDIKHNRVDTYLANTVVLATGGANRAYLYSSNPNGATGDGIAMAWRAGCRIVNMEFMQFHPTCLYHPRAKAELISETVRGEGGILTLSDGDRFIKRFDKRMELAPRDVVARAIDYELKRTGADHVYLDISHKSAEFIKTRFPNLYQTCQRYHFDLTKQAIPVVPAAHYTCGGVHTDIHGQTDLIDLYAIGEVAHTGLHGANRIASNSLLECLVFAQAASAHIEKHRPPSPPDTDFHDVPIWDASQVTRSDEAVLISHSWDEIRRLMWNYVGIVRTDKRLFRAQRRLALLSDEIHEYYANFHINADLLELRNLATIADLIVRSALMRKESRGLHYTLDYPDALPTAADTTLQLHE